MANTIVSVVLPHGLTSHVIKLYQADTLLNTGGDALTAGSNNTTRYTATVTEAVTGDVYAEIENSGGTKIAAFAIYGMDDDTNTYPCEEVKTGVLASDLPANFSSLGINASGHVSRVTLTDTTTTNSDMRGTDNAGTAAELAKVPKSDSNVTWNATALGSIQSEATDALNAYDPPTRAELTSDTNSILSKLLKYVQLLFRKDAAIATDNATELTAINADGGSGAGAASNQTDSLEANRDNIGTDGANLTVTAGTVSDKTGYSISGTLTTLDALWAKIKAWLGALAGKTADTATRTEIQSTVAGAGYNETTDSQEAIRDRGDAAWTGGGGGGDTEEIVDAVVAALADRTLVIVSGLDENGTITIWQGDGYTGSNAIEIPIEDWDGEDPATYSACKFALMLTSDYNAGTGEAALEVDVVGELNSTTATFAIELTDEQTDALTPSPALDRYNYTYQLRAVEHGGDKKTILTGVATVRRRVVST